MLFQKKLFERDPASLNAETLSLLQASLIGTHVRPGRTQSFSCVMRIHQRCRKFGRG
jgi:hypothetical protein